MSDIVTYASGEIPKRGDKIQYANMSRWDKQSNPECGELWKVTGISDDMVTARCVGKNAWKQAFMTAKMEKIREMV